MNTMKWLLRREFWENKGSMLWAPVVVAGIMLLTMGGSLIYGLATHGIRGSFTVNGVYVQGSGALRSIPAEMREQLVNVATSGYLVTAAPLFALLGIVVFFYCLGALYDERRDRSILFWKSLPASDQITVLSKVITAAAVTPLITLATATAMSLALLLLACTALAFNGVNLFATVLLSPQLYLAPLALLSLLPVYALWALPTIGWLLLVSSWARSKVFLWAVGTPLVAVLIAKWISYLMNNFFDSGNGFAAFVADIVGRGLGGLIPGIWFAFEDIHPSLLLQSGDKGLDLGSIVAQSWMTLASPNLWAGVVAGGLMIFGAIRIRRFRAEG